MKRDVGDFYDFGTMAINFLEELEVMNAAIRDASQKESQAYKLSLITLFLIQNYTTILNDLREDLGIDKP